MAYMTGCGFPTTSSQKGPLSESPLRDAVPLPRLDPTLQDLACTFPVFEMGVEQTKNIIRDGGFGVSVTKTRWMLEGDGAQPTVILDKISREGEEPLKVNLTVGSLLDDPPTVYTYERIEGGWRLTK
jgi:hypothetical protein